MSGKKIMVLILFTYLVSAYLFSGLICCLAFLNELKQRASPSLWQGFVTGLASFGILLFWPIWIILDFRETELLKHTQEIVGLSRFILISKSTERLENQTKL